MRIHELRAEIWLPQPPEVVFPFFGDAGNLEKLTPDFMHFHIVTPQPIAMHSGALIDYKLRVRGIPIRWRTRINDWEPPHRFTDEQLRGPYRQWLHEHTFEAQNGGTLCRDWVRYAVPFDFFGLVNRFLVRRDVDQIFRFRTEKLRERFGSQSRRWRSFDAPRRIHEDIFASRLGGWLRACLRICIEKAALAAILSTDFVERPGFGKKEPWTKAVGLFPENP